MSLFSELKRRNVFRVGAAYAVVGWLIIQLIDTLVPLLDVPDWIGKAILLVIVAGFPIALLFAWAFELTPDGVKKTAEVDADASITPATGQKLNYFITGALVLAVGYIAYGEFTGVPVGTGEAVNEAGRTTVTSIAVLPFVNMSSDPEQEYFSDGISEELLNVLTKVDGLKVAARTSSFSFKGQNRPVGEIAEVLGVGHILEGSVRKAGNQIRITAQLIRVSDGFHMWSETYDRELVNIFAIQDEIAQAIVSELRVRLTDETQVSVASASTIDPEAYQEYLKGRYLWNLRTVEFLYQSIEHFERATELDPEYHDAWVGLAETWITLPGWEEDNDKAPEQFERAKLAAEKALTISPRSARAHAVLASWHQDRLEWRESLAKYELALAIEPDNATSLQWYSGLLVNLGRIDEALAAVERAVELEPRSRIIGIIAAEVLLHSGQYHAAVERAESTLSFAPDFSYAWEFKGIAHLAAGEFDEARAALLTMSRLDGEQTNPVLTFIDAAERFAISGEAGELPDGLAELIEFDSYFAAPILVSAGQYEAALDYIERQSRTSLPETVTRFLRSAQFREALGDMPRYQDLVERLTTVEDGAD